MTRKIITISCVTLILNACCEKKAQESQKTCETYSVCSIDALPEEDYSGWVPITDMQTSFNTRPEGTYWVHMEGRNNHGLSEFRWIQRKWDKDVYSTWRHRSNITTEEFFREGMNLRQKGYVRVSLQVFVDGSGIARHQVLWVKPVAENVIEKPPKGTARRAIIPEITLSTLRGQTGTARTTQVEQE